MNEKREGENQQQDDGDGRSGGDESSRKTSAPKTSFKLLVDRGPSGGTNVIISNRIRMKGFNPGRQFRCSSLNLNMDEED